MADVLMEEEMRKKGKSGSRDLDETVSSPKMDELEAAKAEMGQVMEENQRLKSYLDQMMKEYQALEMRFYEEAHNNGGQKSSENEEAGLSLSLGRMLSGESTNKDEANNSQAQHDSQEVFKDGNELALGLGYKDDEFRESEKSKELAMVPNASTENSSDEAKGEAGETWPPSKALKTVKGNGGRDEEGGQQPPVKKARVSVRARCDTPTMNDGCQWRKYGQKIAKGNPCPRAYYRCTVAPSCPVRKQVQRCADDMSILITTYEGTHNHPLPISATAMASTTSAAAYMLTSGSSTSGAIGSTYSSSAATTTAMNNANNLSSNTLTNLYGLNFNMSETSRSRPIFMPNSSFFATPSQPMITLDLTASSNSSSSSSHYNRLSSSSFAPRSYPPSSSLTFNSSDLGNPNPTPNNGSGISWPTNGLLNYNSTTPMNNKALIGPTSISLGSRSSHQDSLYQSLLQERDTTQNPSKDQYAQPPPNTIVAAARAITSDPSFQSVLTAALSTLMGGNGHASGANRGENKGGANVENPINRIVHTEKQPSTSSSLQQVGGGTKGNGCASSLLNVAPSDSTTNQGGRSMYISSSIPVPTSSKSTSTSPGDNREH